MIVDAKQAFGIVADGSDETAKIRQAMEVATGENSGEMVYFPPGIYGCDGLDTIDNVASFFGAGPRRTKFKNLSPDTRLFEFRGSAQPGDMATSFLKVKGFSVDQNGCTADAFSLNTMYSRLEDIWITGQAGDGWAVNAKKCTLSKLMDDVHITRSTNGLLLDDCYYPRVLNSSIERTFGVGLKVIGCAEPAFDHLYVDHGPPDCASGHAPELVQIINSDAVQFNGLAMELSNGANLTPNRYMEFKNSDVQVRSARINQNGPESSAYMFWADNAQLSIDGAKWFEYQPAMVFVGGTGAETSLSLRGIEAYYSSPASPNRYAIGCWEGQIRKVEVNGWRDLAGQTQVWINAGIVDIRDANFVRMA